MFDVQRHQRDDHDEERQAVQPEAGGGAEEERDAGEQRPEHAREIELNRVERDRVRQVLLVHERRDQRLIGGTAEGLREPGHERQRQDVPDAHVAEEHQRRQNERGGHLDVLRAEQQTTAIVAIGDDAADQREQQDRQLAEEIIEPEEERRLGEIENQPALRDLLHPRADR